MRTPGWLARLTGLVAAASASAAVAGPADAPHYAAAFDKAFSEGFAVETFTAAEAGAPERRENVPFRVVDAGRVKILGHQICAADPFVQMGEALPFTQAVPQGEHPVRLAVGNFPSGGHRIAFARVDFSAAPVVRWQMALNAKQDIATLKGDEVFGYPVDAGTGSFYDPKAGEAANALLKQNPDAWEQWQTDGEANGPKVIGPYSFLLNLPLGEANVIMFHSGWGDGLYPSWFGFDAQGNVAALVTDFQTIDWATAKW